MRKRLLMLVVMLAATVLATGCCSWAKKHCPIDKDTCCPWAKSNCTERKDGQQVPGPVIRLGLQGGGGVWTVDEQPQQVLSQSNNTLRRDFIGTSTAEMKCVKSDGEEVDAFTLRLTMEDHIVEVVRGTGALNQPHWHVIRSSNGGSIVIELLPNNEVKTGSVPPELKNPTAIEMIKGTTVTTCSGLKLRID